MAKNRTIIETVFAARDKLSKTIEKMTKKSNAFGKGTDAAFKKASKAASKFGKIIHDMPFKENDFYFDQYLLPLFQRLCESDWHTARISALCFYRNCENILL